MKEQLLAEEQSQQLVRDLVQQVVEECKRKWQELQTACSQKYQFLKKRNGLI